MLGFRVCRVAVQEFKLWVYRVYRLELPKYGYVESNRASLLVFRSLNIIIVMQFL